MPSLIWENAMTIRDNNSPRVPGKELGPRHGERGAALATALLMMVLLSAVAVTVLAVVQSETRIAGGDLKRTQTFYAAASAIEKMTSDFSALYGRTSRPTQTQLDTIAAAYPSELVSEGFDFTNPQQSIVPDSVTLASMRTTQGVSAPSLPRVTMPANSPFGGLIASVNPFILTSTATAPDGTQVALTRNMNNYLIPLFQFGMFSDEDIELHPGAPFSFNGRVHANGNIYANGAGPVKFLDKVTSAHEFIYDVMRNGNSKDVNTSASMDVQPVPVNSIINKGSMVGGPNTAGAPSGSVNSNWKTTSVQAADGTPNKFGGQLLTSSTGAAVLKLPMELDNNPTREIIRRRLATDSLAPPALPSALTDARYHTKAEIRILIDDEGVTNDAAGLYGSQNGDGTNNVGVNLSSFDPIPLPNVAAASGGGRALWRVPAAGGTTYSEQTTAPASFPLQENNGISGGAAQALTVRGVNPVTRTNVTPTGSTIAIPKIPGGSGISGHILIQIVDANGVVRDVTREILSMGMTEGEPNAIVTLQRPLWAAFVQGSRDSSTTSLIPNPILNNDPAYSNCLTDILTKTHIGADGEIKIDFNNGYPTQDATYGFLTKLVDDTNAGQQPQRPDSPPGLNIADWGLTTCGGGNKDCWSFNKRWNAIVPINIYNVREGRISTTNTSSTATANAVYERGITSVIELNMKNLARWMDGIYDQNLLANTPAVSGNIAKPDGYVVYVSDRRGDNVKSLVVPNAGSDPVTYQTINSTNGMVDNVDVYGPNGTMDAGEDVQSSGLAPGSTLVKDLAELPDPAVLAGTSGADFTARNKRALTVASWTNPNNYFRRAVRLFNGEDLQTTQATGKLSITLGITVASENLLYTWGNYNTTGINTAPPAGISSLNDSSTLYYYLPVSPSDRQVPASIIADAFFPLSKTWFDSESGLYPDDLTKRDADMGLPNVGQETSVRAGIIAGNNLSAMAGSPDAGNSANGESRLNGGMHNFPRFLENWSGTRFNFVGALIPLYRSTQAVGPYNANSTIYSPPIRNWAFDVTFTDPARLPPGTPQFQHVEPTGFRQIL
jgi:hypothetical protein